MICLCRPCKPWSSYLGPTRPNTSWLGERRSANGGVGATPANCTLAIRPPIRRSARAAAQRIPDTLTCPGCAGSILKMVDQIVAAHCNTNLPCTSPFSSISFARAASLSGKMATQNPAIQTGHSLCHRAPRLSLQTIRALRLAAEFDSPARQNARLWHRIRRPPPCGLRFEQTGQRCRFDNRTEGMCLP